MAKCAYCAAHTELSDGGLPVCQECCKPEQNIAKKRRVGLNSIQNILADQIIQTTARVTQENQKFLDLMRQVPRGLPHPDGAQLIRNVCRELFIARKEMMRAHRRLDDFIKRGIVPDDLERSG
jgi:hypothetical protein